MRFRRNDMRLRYRRADESKCSAARCLAAEIRANRRGRFQINSCDTRRMLGQHVAFQYFSVRIAQRWPSKLYQGLNGKRPKRRRARWPWRDWPAGCVDRLRCFAVAGSAVGDKLSTAAPPPRKRHRLAWPAERPSSRNARPSRASAMRLSGRDRWPFHRVGPLCAGSYAARPAPAETVAFCVAGSAAAGRPE
jgi:hypothetical protein